MIRLEPCLVEGGETPVRCSQLEKDDEEPRSCPTAVEQRRNGGRPCGGARRFVAHCAETTRGRGAGYAIAISDQDVAEVLMRSLVRQGLLR